MQSKSERERERERERLCGTHHWACIWSTSVAAALVQGPPEIVKKGGIRNTSHVESYTSSLSSTAARHQQDNSEVTGVVHKRGILMHLARAKQVDSNDVETSRKSLAHLVCVESSLKSKCYVHNAAV